MTYSTTIAGRALQVRWLIKIAGVPHYFSTWGATAGTDTYDDGDDWGELPLLPIIQDVSVSGGKLDYQRHVTTDTTLTLTLQDCATLRTVFGRRATAQYLESTIDADDTLATIGDNSSYSAGDYVHIGRECCLIDAIPSGSTTTLDLTDGRGALGTVAAPHPGGYAGMVGPAPHHWLGRKAVLVLGVNNAGTWEYQDPYRTFYCSASPSYKAGAWELSFSISLSHFDRPFYTGFKDVPIERVKLFAVGATSYVQVVVEDERTFMLPTIMDSDYAAPSLWLTAADGAVGVFAIDSVGAEGSRTLFLLAHGRNKLSHKQRLVHWLREHGAAELEGPGGAAPGDMTCRPCWVFGDGANSADPGQCALAIALSDGIENTGSTWDILPSAAETATAPRIRGGAGLAEAEVDTAAFQRAGASALPYGLFVVGGKHEESLVDFLAQDVAPVLGGYLTVSAAGQLSLVRYEQAHPVETADYTIADANVLSQDNGCDDEEARLVTIEVGSRYDWSRGEFRDRHIAHYEAIRLLYQEGGCRLKINSRFCVLDYETALVSFDSYWARWGDGALTHTVVVPWTGHLVMPGDVVSYTNARLPDFAGGQGITAELYEVVGVAPDLGNGTVRIEMVARPSCKEIAPVAAIDSAVSGSSDTYYIVSQSLPSRGAWNGDPLFQRLYAPGPSGVAGWKVKFYRPGSGEWLTTSGASEFELLDVDVTYPPSYPCTMQFDNPPELLVNDLVVFAPYATASGITATNYYGEAMTDFAYLDGDEANPDGAAHKWG